MTHFSESKLENGLTLVVGNDPSSPIATIRLSVMAGSATEPPAQHGYAHILEHMLLKGNEKRPTSLDIGLALDRIGAWSNANTAFEVSHFIMQSASEHAELLLEIMSDNIMHPVIDAAVLEKEKDIIVQELLQSESALPRKTLTLAVAQYLDGHPYSSDPIGTESSIRAATRESILQYKDAFYVPSNAILTITGNLSEESALSLAEKYFDSWQSQAHSDVHFPALHILPGQKIQANESPTSYLAVLFAIEAPTTVRETAALECLSNLLTMGYSSLLKEALRSKTGLVYGVSSWFRRYTTSTLFGITTSSVKPQQVITNITESLAGISALLPDMTTILKTQTLGVMKRRLADPLFLNEFASTLAIFNDSNPEEYLSVIDALTTDDLRKAYEKFLAPSAQFSFIFGKQE